MKIWNSLDDKWVDSSKAVEMESDNWYIMMGYPGFNSPANNRFGYESKEKAIAAIIRYSKKG